MDVKDKIAIYLRITCVILVLSGVLIGKGIFLGSLITQPLHLSYNRYVVALLFVVTFWLSSKMGKSISAGWSRPLRLILTGAMLIGMLSYGINK